AARQSPWRSSTDLHSAALPQEAEMFVSPFVLRVSELNPDCTLTNVNGECLQIVTLTAETSSALEIETPAVPIAGEDAVPACSTGQGVPHVGALVVGGVDPALDIEQRDTATFSEPDGFRLTHGNIGERGHLCPLRHMFVPLLLMRLQRCHR